MTLSVNETEASYYRIKCLWADKVVKHIHIPWIPCSISWIPPIPNILSLFLSQSWPAPSLELNLLIDCITLQYLLTVGAPV